MWANVHRDGRPAEYRWRPLFNTAKFGGRPLLKAKTLMPNTHFVQALSHDRPTSHTDTHTNTTRITRTTMVS